MIEIEKKLEKLIGDLEYMHDFFDSIKREDIIELQAQAREILDLFQRVR